MKTKTIRDIANSVFAKLPVFGPHAGIEAELLLGGKKPIGWLPVYPDNIQHTHALPADVQKEIDDVKKLDQAVAEGKLKSYDVVVNGSIPPFTETHENIFRHYCQPENFHEMLEIAAYNEDLFNGREPRTQKTKTYGDYLGYRKKDQNYWEKGWTSAVPKEILDSKFFQKSPIPKILDDVSTFINKNIAQPAYQYDQLRQIEKEQAQNKSTPVPSSKPKM